MMSAVALSFLAFGLGFLFAMFLLELIESRTDREDELDVDGELERVWEANR